MERLWLDKGHTWSIFFWNKITAKIPEVLFPGMTWISDAWVAHLDNFYQDILHAFADVNELFASTYPDPLPQQNLWAVTKNKKINYAFIQAGFVEVGDLPMKNGSIDWKVVHNTVCANAQGAVFLICV